jgi:hypothetical protein
MTYLDSAHTRVRRCDPAPETRLLSTLGRVDYADEFIVDVGPTAHRLAEQWMRVILEDSPASMRVKLLSGWSAIGLKVQLTDSGRSVLGWDIRDSGPDHVLLGAESRIGMPGELLLCRREHELLFATFVRHDNPFARALWSSIEARHGRTVTVLLEMAGRRIAG